jgi:hypothetical protein
MTPVLAIALLRLGFIIALPFVVLVRGAVWLHQRYGVGAWIALGGAAQATLVVLTLYGGWIVRRITGRARWGHVAKWIAAPLVVCYCGFGLLYLSRLNAKTDAVRAVYTATHPLLRLALATLILVDRDAVITDLARSPDDYSRMGLPVNARSRHYRQPDGWVHAVDLRTQGRPIASRLTAGYFRAMGFTTLRHEGSAEHLHVEIK